MKKKRREKKKKKERRAKPCEESIRKWSGTRKKNWSKITLKKISQTSGKVEVRGLGKEMVFWQGEQWKSKKKS